MNAQQQAQLIATLRGQAPGDGPASQAGLALRALVLAEMQADAASASEAAKAATPTAADDALMARLRAHGAFTPRRFKRRWPTLRWPSAGWVMLPSLATALGMGVLMLRPPAPPPLDDAGQGSQLRGAEQAQRIAVADPAAWAADVQALFAAHKLALRRVDLPGRQGIELQALLPPEQAALREALAARGIQVATHGRLFLRVVMAQD